MKSIIQDMKQNYFVNAVIMVVLGLVLVIWPHILGVMLCYLLGGALILMGVIQLVVFLRGERLGFYNKLCSWGSCSCCWGYGSARSRVSCCRSSR